MRRYFQKNTPTEEACGNGAERKHNFFLVHVRIAMPEEHVLRITHLRDCLGWAYQQVARTGEPIVIQRYKAQDVVLVPLWEWRFFQQLEADIRAGRCPWETGTDEHHPPPEESSESGPELA